MHAATGTDLTAWATLWAMTRVWRGAAAAAAAAATTTTTTTTTADAAARLRVIAEDGNMPHLILTGPPGVCPC